MPVNHPDVDAISKSTHFGRLPGQIQDPSNQVIMTSVRYEQTGSAAKSPGSGTGSIIMTNRSVMLTGFCGPTGHNSLAQPTGPGLWDPAPLVRKIGGAKSTVLGVPPVSKVWPFTRHISHRGAMTDGSRAFQRPVGRPPQKSPRRSATAEIHGWMKWHPTFSSVAPRREYLITTPSVG